MDPIAEMASPGIPSLAAREAKRFDEILAGLDEAGWRHPVLACPPWAVRDLTSHAAYVAEMYSGSVRKSLAGNPGPLWEDPAAARKERYAARLALDHRELLADFRDAVAAIGRTWQEAKPSDYATPAWHPAGMWSVGRLQVAWLWEISIHCHDLRSAFDPGAGFDRDAIPTFVEYMSRALPRYLGPESDPELSAIYKFALTDPTRSVSVRLSKGTFEVAPDGASDADVTFNTDGATWILAMLNRLDPLEATPEGRIRVDGDPALAERFWKQLKRI